MVKHHIANANLMVSGVALGRCVSVVDIHMPDVDYMDWNPFLCGVRLE